MAKLELTLPVIMQIIGRPMLGYDKLREQGRAEIIEQVFDKSIERTILFIEDTLESILNSLEKDPQRDFYNAKLAGCLNYSQPIITCSVFVSFLDKKNTRKQVEVAATLQTPQFVHYTCDLSSCSDDTFFPGIDRMLEVALPTNRKVDILRIIDEMYGKFIELPRNEWITLVDVTRGYDEKTFKQFAFKD